MRRPTQTLMPWPWQLLIPWQSPIPRPKLIQRLTLIPSEREGAGEGEGDVAGVGEGGEDIGDKCATS